jgi:hypothetical protein
MVAVVPTLSIAFGSSFTRHGERHHGPTCAPNEIVKTQRHSGNTSPGISERPPLMFSTLLLMQFSNIFPIYYGICGDISVFR